MSGWRGAGSDRQLGARILRFSEPESGLCWKSGSIPRNPSPARRNTGSRFFAAMLERELGARLDLAPQVKVKGLPIGEDLSKPACRAERCAEAIPDAGGFALVVSARAKSVKREDFALEAFRVSAFWTPKKWTFIMATTPTFISFRMNAVNTARS